MMRWRSCCSGVLKAVCPLSPSSSRWPAIRTPDMPLVKVLSWVPLFTPFLMPARIPSEPPLWEIAGTMLGMAMMAAVMVWIGGKAFRAGALATGKLDWKNVLAAMRGERS